MLRELIKSQDVLGLLAERLLRGEVTSGFGGERIPGFGHPLYPDGDPRAANILDAMQKANPSRSHAVLRIGSAISDLVGRKPNFDFSLGAVAVMLDLPRGAGLGIWLIGRTVGWIAHAMEQYASETLIRPRARYGGVLPVTEVTGTS
jgi:citrate synthase